MAELSDLIGNSDEFPVLKHWNFLNHAGVSPMPKVVGDAVRTIADQCEQGAYLGSNWFELIDQTRAQAATLVNADVDEIALVKNTSEAVSIVAMGLDWKPGDRVVYRGGRISRQCVSLDGSCQKIRHRTGHGSRRNR